MNHKINESQLSTADTKAIFKNAAASREPSGLGKIFKGLRKDKIEVSDLQKAWQEAGYPDDTRDISSILVKHGFSKSEINKVFAKVFGQDSDTGEYKEPVASEAIQKIVKYAKEHGLVDDLKAFMSTEFGLKESYKIAMVEDVREIFTAIVKEERTERDTLIRHHEHTQLGRSKK